MSFKLTKDTKVWDRIKKNIKQAEVYNLNLGWFEENKYGPSNDNLQMAQVAQWNNEGHRNDNGTITPPRPFMTVGLRSAFKAGANKDDFKDMINSLFEGKSILTAMKAASNNFERTLRKVMLDWDTPPNAPLTIELKGFDDPLVNSSELIANVTAKVEKKGDS